MKTKLQKHLDNMSVEEKALLLNILMKEVYPGTPLQGECTVSGICKSYNRETNMILDHLIWQFWGIHYKEYIDVIGPILMFDPFGFEDAVDSRITHFMEELYEQGKQTVYKF